MGGVDERLTDSDDRQRSIAQVALDPRIVFRTASQQAGFWLPGVTVSTKRAESQAIRPGVRQEFSDWIRLPSVPPVHFVFNSNVTLSILPWNSNGVA